MDWTLTQMRYVVAVAEHRGFGSAARACHVTQPTLSMQVKKIEDLLGATLFDRSSTPVTTTTLGQQVVAQAKRVLDQTRRLEDLVMHTKEEVSGTVRLGVIPTLAPYLLPLAWPKLQAQYPKLTLSVEERQTDAIVSALKRGDLDIGLLATPLDERDIREKPLFLEPFHLYSSPGHPLSNQELVRESDLNPDELWVLSEGHCLRVQALSLCKKMERRRTRGRSLVFEGGSLETLMRIVENGSGYTLVPELAISGCAYPENARPFSGQPPVREVSLVCHATYPRKKIMNVLIEALRSVVPNYLLCEVGHVLRPG